MLRGEIAPRLLKTTSEKNSKRGCLLDGVCSDQRLIGSACGLPPGQRFFMGNLANLLKVSAKHSDLLNQGIRQL